RIPSEMTAADFADLPHLTSQLDGSSRRRRRKARSVAVVPLPAPLSKRLPATPLTELPRQRDCAAPQSPGAGACGRQREDRLPSDLHQSVEAGCRVRCPEQVARPRSGQVLATQATREDLP